jgi:hypothetical protein
MLYRSAKLKSTYFSNMPFHNLLIFNNLLWDGCGIALRLYALEISAGARNPSGPIPPWV